MSGNTLRHLPRGVLCLLFVECFLMGNSEAWTQALSPYSEFQSMTESQLGELQVRLTYVGIEGPKMGPSIVFCSLENDPDISVFEPYQRPGISYFNATASSSIGMRVSVASLKGIIDSVGVLPQVTAGAVDSSRVLSFGLFNSFAGDRAFESVLDQVGTRSLFNQLRQALRNEDVEALILLDNLACPLDANDQSEPLDVSSSVTITLSGFKLDNKTDLFITEATVTNVSATPIEGPISLVVRSESCCFELLAIARTCNITYGSVYVNLSLPNGSLAPGASVRQLLQFENPQHEVINISIRPYAGPGGR